MICETGICGYGGFVHSMSMMYDILEDSETYGYLALVVATILNSSNLIEHRTLIA